MMTKTVREMRSTTVKSAAAIACMILLVWAGVKLYERWFGLGKEEKKFRALYTSEYARQPERQEALSQWMSQGIIKAISKHGI
jgi:hypothetical protein